MKHRLAFLLWAPIALAVILLASVLPSDARDLAKVFESKPVTVITGASPGGGYDTFSRMVARFSGKYLPGNPRFIVKNIPGGGQLRGLRAAMRAKPDGLTLGLLHPRFVQRELTGIDVPDFDLKTVRIIGSPSANKTTRLWCTRRDIATTWDEVKKVGRRLTNGNSAPGAANGLGPGFVSQLGGPIKMVYGYGGTSDIMAAFDRGELDSTDRCTVEHVPRLFPRWVKEKMIAPIFWWERKSSSDWLEKLGARNVPYLLDILDLNADQRNAFEVANQFLYFSRIFIAPPGVPEDMYNAWTKAFEATTRDPGFLKAAQAAGLEVGLGTADDFNELLKAFQKLTPAGAKVLKRLIAQ